jgi:three-Cys-motif partner protein
MDRSTLVPYAGREQASVKHFLLESYLTRLIMITARSRYDRIAYIDAFAGPWQSAQENLSDTSFAKAIEVVEGCRAQLANAFNRSVRFRALFVERDPDRFVRLKQFADSRSTSEVEIVAVNEDFASSTESVARWIRDDEMAFVLVDPTGWKTVIAPSTLAPLLRKSNVEMLINVMWNFIALATGHANQRKNLREIFGHAYDSICEASGRSDAETLMDGYLNALRAGAGEVESTTQLRTTSFPVQFPSKDRVFYFLVYVTHHVKGMIVFLQESERALHYQREVKFVIGQQRREADTGMADIFGDELYEMGSVPRSIEPHIRAAWLALLPSVGAEVHVDETCVAGMAQQCGCLISDLQAALRHLIEEGVLKNVDAKQARSKNVVNYERGEKIRRLK